MGVPVAPRFRIRLAEDDSPELFCYGCREWWPVSIEFWPSRTSFWRCRACEKERARLYQVRKLLDPEGRIKNVNKSRRYRAYLRGEEPELLPVNEAVAREYNAAKARRRRFETREEAKAAERAYKREWMRRDRARKREAEGRAKHERKAA